MALQVHNLPLADSPNICLVQATEEEKIQCWEINGSSWRGALSLPTYLRREEHLANQAFTRDGGITYWILTDTIASISPSSPRTILASCESLRKKALLARKDRSVEEITIHGIGSVFCRPEFRGKGYGVRMMKELGDTLERWQQRDGCQTVFTVLYSDIGKKYYSRNGWRPFSSSHISLLPIRESHGAGEQTKYPKSKPLEAADLPSLCGDDISLLRRKLAEPAHGSADHRVALVPDVETMQWHHAREEFAATELLDRIPDIKGAIATGLNGKRAWCIWTRTFGNTQKTNTLHILRLVSEGEGGISRQARTDAPDHEGADERDVLTVAAVLLAAQREAALWDMAEVQLWNPSPVTVLAARKILPSAFVVDRDEESITCLRWSGLGQGTMKEIDWVGNEKFGWC